MFNVTNQASAQALHPMFEAVQIQFDWPHVFRTPMTGRSCDRADVHSSGPANELAILLGGMAEPHERALQALATCVIYYRPKVSPSSMRF